MKRLTFLTVGGAAALSACGRQGASSLVPAAAPATAVRAANVSARTRELDPALPLPNPAIIGEVRRFDGAVAPPGWAFCDGTVLPIADYPNLFKLLGHGTGDGKKTFSLPRATRLPVLIATAGVLVMTPRQLADVFATRGAKSPASASGVVPAVRSV